MLYLTKLVTLLLALCVSLSSAAFHINSAPSLDLSTLNTVAGQQTRGFLSTLKAQQKIKKGLLERTACGYCELVVGELRNFFLHTKEKLADKAIHEFCEVFEADQDDDDWFNVPLHKICSEGGRYLLFQELHALAELTEPSGICQQLLLCEAPSCNGWHTGVNGECYKPIQDSSLQFTFQSYEQSETLCAFHHGQVCSLDDYLRVIDPVDVINFNSAIGDLLGAPGNPTDGFVWLRSKAKVEYAATASATNGAPVSGGVNTDRPWSITGVWESIEHGNDKVYQLAVETRSGLLQILPHLQMVGLDNYVAGEGASQTNGVNVGAVVCCRSPWSLTERGHGKN